MHQFTEQEIIEIFDNAYGVSLFFLTLYPSQSSPRQHSFPVQPEHPSSFGLLHSTATASHLIVPPCNLDLIHSHLNPGGGGSCGSIMHPPPSRSSQSQVSKSIHGQRESEE